MLFQFMCEKKFLSFTLFRGGGTVHCTVQYLPVLYSTMLGACISYSVSKFDCPKSFHKTLKIEFRGSIFDLNSTQVWAIMCKSAIIKINSLFHQGSIFSSDGGVSTWWAIVSLPGNFLDKYGILNILKIIFIKFE